MKTLIYDEEPVTLMLTRYDERFGGGLCIAILDKDKNMIDELSWNLFPNPDGDLGDDKIAIEQCNSALFEEYGLGKFKRSVSEGTYVYHIMEINWDVLNQYVSVDKRHDI